MHLDDAFARLDLAIEDSPEDFLAHSIGQRRLFDPGRMGGVLDQRGCILPRVSSATSEAVCGAIAWSSLPERCIAHFLSKAYHDRCAANAIARTLGTLDRKVKMIIC